MLTKKFTIPFTPGDIVECNGARCTVVTARRGNLLLSVIGGHVMEGESMVVQESKRTDAQLDAKKKKKEPKEENEA